MKYETHVASPTLRRFAVWLASSLAFFPGSNLVTAMGQQPATKSSVGQIPSRDLLRARGTVVSEGNNQNPVGPLKLKAYRLEEIELSGPLDVDLGVGEEKIQSVFRLTITSENFVPGDYAIWVGDVFLGIAGATRTEISVLVLTPRMLEHGALVSVTHVNQPNIDSRTTLPQRLLLPPKLQLMSRPMNASFEISIRRVVSSEPLHGQPGVEIVITSNVQLLQIRNQLFVMQIGADQFSIVHSPEEAGFKSVVFTLTPKQFDELKDGEKIILKWGSRTLSGRNVGRLNKNLLKE